MYLDTCIFIAWMKNERRQNLQLDGVLETINEVEARRLRVITSVITRQREIPEANNKPEAMVLLAGLLKRENVEEVDVLPWITKLAATFQHHYSVLHESDGAGILTENDAIHLATAVCYDADAFYTFDNGKKPTPDGKKTRSLLSLDGSVAGHPLVVCAPPTHQLSLHYDEKE